MRKLLLLLPWALSLLLAQPAFTQTGTADPFEANPDDFAHIYATATQLDGKVLIAGDFVSINGVSRAAGIARLNADGTLDTAFNPAIGGGTWQVFALAALPDGKVLIGGSFNGIGAYPIHRLARLNADGTPDLTFSTEPDSHVFTIVPLADGQTLIGGSFTTLQSGLHTRSHYARLNADGSVDTAFNPPSNSGFTALAVQPDGKVLIGGSGTVAGNARTVARLNTDGSLDSTFADPGANSVVSAVLAQPDGKVLIGGQFTVVGGVNRYGLSRLNSNGTRDVGFSTLLNNTALVRTLSLQANGSLIYGGQFNLTNGVLRNNIARVLSTGALDTTFNPNSGGVMWATALQSDGRALVTGAFHHVATPFVLIAGAQRNGMARLFNDTATSTFTVPSQSTITWTSGGTTPEAISTRFEVSTDGGSTWSFVGIGARSGASWQITGLSLPLTGIVRVLATVPVSHQGGTSAGIVTAARSYQFSPAAEVITLAATNPSVSSIILNASVDANGDPTTVSFQYGLSTTYGSSITASFAPNNGLAPQAASATLSGLTAHALYHTRVVATNSSGTSYGEDVTFVANTPPPAPVLSATTITENNAAGAIIGTLGPVTDSDGDAITYSLATGAGDTDNPSFLIVGNTLRANYPFDYELQTSFSVRVRASDGFLNGDADATFTITVINVIEAPIVSTTTASNVRHTSAALNAQVNPNSNFTTVQFEWGPTTSYGNVAPLLFFGAMDATSHDVQTYIGGLTIGSTYHYRVIASNAEGTATGLDQTFTTRATSPGDLELAFNPDVQGGHVQCMAVQPDGKILIGGYFTQVNGVPVNNLARLNADGSVDASFAPDPNNLVNCITVLLNGKILIGGDFDLVAGGSRPKLARLHPNGALDTSFNASMNGSVDVLLLDLGFDRIYIAGSFTIAGGGSRQGFARLQSSGGVDATLPDLAPNGPIQCMALDVSTNTFDGGDGGVLVGGSFSQIGGLTYHGLARIHGPGISPGYGGGPGVPTLDVGSTVTSIARADGDFFIGGNISKSGDSSYIAHFSNSGIFLGWGWGGSQPVLDGVVLALAVQSDGKVLLGGQFTTVNGQPFTGLARIESNGLLDTSFDAGPRSPYFFGNAVTKLALQADGRVLTAGTFAYFGGEPRQGFGRLFNSPGTHSFSAHLASLPGTKPWVFDWNFSGSTPMVTSAGLEFSTDNGITWTRATGGAYGGFAYGSGLGGPPTALHTGQDIVTPRLWRAHGYLNGTDALIIDQISFPGSSITDWRLAYFGSADGTGTGADDADPDGDGVVNLLEYAFDSAPTVSSGPPWSTGTALPDGAGGMLFELRFTQPPGVTGIAYTGQWSPSLAPGSWITVPDIGVAPEHVFRVAITPGSPGFMRVVVTRTP